MHASQRGSFASLAVSQLCDTALATTLTMTVLLCDDTLLLADGSQNAFCGKKQQACQSSFHLAVCSLACLMLLCDADFNLDFYTEVQDLSYLIRAMGSDPFSVKYR